LVVPIFAVARANPMDVFTQSGLGLDRIGAPRRLGHRPARQLLAKAAKAVPGEEFLLALER
jgi:hypothetical protein